MNIIFKKKPYQCMLQIQDNIMKKTIIPLIIMFSLGLTLNVKATETIKTADELGLMKGFPPPAGKKIDRSNAIIYPPFNRWSFQNMRKVFPTANIKSAREAIKLDRNIRGGIDNLLVKRKNGEAVNLDTWLHDSYTDSLVVIQGKSVVWERYMNGMHADQPHQMMSVTKSFAGLLGLLAIEDGKFKENDKIIKWIPELKKSSAFKDATFRQVADMVNSMSFSEAYADPKSDIVEYGKVLGLIKAPDEEIPANSIYEYLATLKKDNKNEHGEVFHYQTPKADVVNWVVNRATGKPFQDYIFEKLWSRLGTDGEAYVLLDNQGTLFAGGGLNATPNDLARFAMMMLNNGRFNSQQVVPKSVIAKLAKGGSIKAFKKGPSMHGIRGDGHWSYRSQWWVRGTPGHEAFTAIGIHGQFIYIDLTRNVAIVKQSSLPASSQDVDMTFNINAFDAIIEYLTQSQTLKEHDN